MPQNCINFTEPGNEYTTEGNTGKILTN